MPWKETAPMLERTPGIAADLRHVYAMTERCERFGMRRHTGDTWVRRETAPGPAGLQAQRRAPHRSPPRLSEAGEAVLWDAKRAHRHWGPRTLRPDLARRRPALALPAPRTGGARCPRAGFSQARPRRRGHRHPGAIPVPAEPPNAVWTADFKGQFRTGEGLAAPPGRWPTPTAACSAVARRGSRPSRWRPAPSARAGSRTMACPTRCARTPAHQAPPLPSAA